MVSFDWSIDVVEIMPWLHDSIASTGIQRNEVCKPSTRGSRRGSNLSIQRQNRESSFTFFLLLYRICMHQVIQRYFLPLNYLTLAKNTIHDAQMPLRCVIATVNIDSGSVSIFGIVVLTLWRRFVMYAFPTYAFSTWVQYH